MSIALLCWLSFLSTGELVLLLRMRRLMSLFHERPYMTSSKMLRDLPSVSVCIAARNERHAMTRCIESVLSSTYPKLEVLVLDDDSVDSTSGLIKAFAHEGVRFIQGGSLPDGWLGRNYSFGRLLGESNGTYVLFLSVDTILSPQSIAQMVAYAESTKSEMVSVLPQRISSLSPRILFAPFRYFWQVVGHRASQPMVASSVWMARRRTLQADFGDLSSVASSVEPEVTFAQKYFAQSAYKFLASRRMLGVKYDKKMSSQIETIIRVRYPELGFSFLATTATSLLKVAVALSPLAVFLGGSSALLAVIAYLLGSLVYRVYLQFTWNYGALISMWLWPLILLFDAYLSMLSMVRHLTGSVMWKGRQITARR